MSWTIDDKIRAMVADLGDWRTDMRDQLKRLRISRDPSDVLHKMGSELEKLCAQVGNAASICQFPDSLNQQIRTLDKSKRGLNLPSNVIQCMDFVRLMHNHSDHWDDQVKPRPRFTINDVEATLTAFFRILEWFYCECPASLGLPSIHSLGKYPRPGYAFRRVPRVRVAIGLDKGLNALLRWCDHGKSVVLSIEAPKSQGKTTLAAWLCRNLSGPDESEVQWEVYWIKCSANLSFDDLMADFSREMEKRGITEAAIVSNPTLPLQPRLDTLVGFLNETENPWLIVLDDFHLAEQGPESEKWQNLEIYFSEISKQAKLIVVREQSAEASQYADIPDHSHVRWSLPSMDEDTALEFLQTSKLEADESILRKICKKCGGQPGLLKVFANEANRTSIREVLNQWPASIEKLLEQRVNELSPEAQTGARRIAKLTEVEPMERSIIDATGVTNEVFRELDKNFFLERNNEEQFWLNTVFDDYMQNTSDSDDEDLTAWMGPALNKLILDASIKASITGNKQAVQHMVSQWMSFRPLGQVPVYMILDWIGFHKKRLGQNDAAAGYWKLTVQACELAGEDSLPMSIHPRSHLELGKLAEAHGKDEEAETHYRKSWKGCDDFERCLNSCGLPDDLESSAGEAAQELFVNTKGGAFEISLQTDWAPPNEWEEVYQTRIKALKTLYRLCERTDRPEEAAELRQKVEQMPEDPS